MPIGEAALALASFERPRVGLAAIASIWRLWRRDVGRHPDAGGDLAARARALNEILLLKHGYSGDELTYDDLQNANLMRVVDRRKGLPVALGILYLHAARAQGWDCVGLGFPGPFPGPPFGRRRAADPRPVPRRQGVRRRRRCATC